MESSIKSFEERFVMRSGGVYAGVCPHYLYNKRDVDSFSVPPMNIRYPSKILEGLDPKFFVEIEGETLAVCNWKGAYCQPVYGKEGERIIKYGSTGSVPCSIKQLWPSYGALYLSCVYLQKGLLEEKGIPEVEMKSFVFNEEGTNSLLTLKTSKFGSDWRIVVNDTITGIDPIESIEKPLRELLSGKKNRVYSPEYTAESLALVKNNTIQLSTPKGRIFSPIKLELPCLTRKQSFQHQDSDGDPAKVLDSLGLPIGDIECRLCPLLSKCYHPISISSFQPKKKLTRGEKLFLKQRNSWSEKKRTINDKSS